jgi:hypothetical protein
LAANRRIPAIKVHQWLKAWDKVDFSPKQHRRKPLSYFFLFSLPAAELRGLCGIARRQSKGVTPRAADLGIQRQLDVERTEEIKRFVEYGFPWSTLSEAKRKSPTYNNLRKPGWLPTAILINILNPGEARQEQKLSEKDVVKVDEKTNAIELPYSSWSETWEPTGLPPFEVIDGQHRLWAFGNDKHTSSFEVPVVAFHGLDVSWQAYLFWTINIKPKRINASLAFDLYPLLRGEDWLDSDEAYSVYRETRSQELTEAFGRIQPALGTIESTCSAKRAWTGSRNPLGSRVCLRHWFAHGRDDVLRPEGYSAPDCRRTGRSSVGPELSKLLS